MCQGKQAKIITSKQTDIILAHLRANTRLPEKNVALFLLSLKAGLRSKECANVIWKDCLNSDGEVGDYITIRDAVSKGENGGGIIPLNKDLKQALIDLWKIRKNKVNPSMKIIYSQQASSCSANSVTVWFHRLYETLGFTGMSSHSGRATMITSAARKISNCGGSLRDVQSLARHSSIANTERYVRINEDAKKKVMDII